MNPDAGALALASIEVDLTPIAEGQSITVMWRGKPVFIRNRTKEEVESFQDRDGIDRLAKHLLEERGAITADSYKQMGKEVRKQVRDAVKFAEDSPEPALSELTTDVYANIEPNLSPTTGYAHGATNPLLRSQNGGGA